MMSTLDSFPFEKWANKSRPDITWSRESFAGLKTFAFPINCMLFGLFCFRFIFTVSPVISSSSDQTTGFPNNHISSTLLSQESESPLPENAPCLNTTSPDAYNISSRRSSLRVFIFRVSDPSIFTIWTKSSENPVTKSDFSSREAKEPFTFIDLLLSLIMTLPQAIPSFLSLFTTMLSPANRPWSSIIDAPPENQPLPVLPLNSPFSQLIIAPLISR